MNLAAELERRGHEVFVFNQRAFLIDQDLVQRLLPASVKVLSMANKPFTSFWTNKANALQKRLGFKPSIYDQQQQVYLAQCLREYKIDVVSSHSTFSDLMCAPVIAAQGIPMVITEHGDYSAFLLDGRQDFGSVLRAARRILTVSDYCKHNLQQAFSDLPPIQTVYNGVVVQQYDKQQMRDSLGIPADAFVFGMVSRGVEKKGWSYAVQAFRQVQQQLPEQKTRLVLVGGSAYLQQLRAECATDEDIIFTGQVPNPDFYVSGFDVGLLPSYFRTEALPLAVIEYMVNGKPSIATRVGGVPELLELATGHTGLLADIDPETHRPDLATLTTAMVRYCTEPELYAAHTQNAKTARQQFTMEACAAQYEDAFQTAVGTPATTARRG